MHGVAGTPDNFPETVNVPDDGSDAPSFANINTGPEGALNRTQWLRQFVSSLACGNWQAPISTFDPGAVFGGGTDPGTLTLQTISWDPYTQRWIGAFHDALPGSGVGMWLMSTHSAGKTWQPIGGSTTAGLCDLGILGSATDAVGNTVVVHAWSNSGSPVTKVCRATYSNTVTDTTQSFLGTLAQAVVVYVSGTGAGFYLFGAQQSGGTFTGKLAT